MGKVSQHRSIKRHLKKERKKGAWIISLVSEEIKHSTKTKNNKTRDNKARKLKSRKAKKY